MKKYRQTQQWFTSAACGLALAASAGLGLAQNTSSTNTFDTEASITSLVHWWGVQSTRTWDGTRDAGGDPLSGSLRVEVPYTEAASEQFMIHYTIANRWGWDNGYTLDATTYTNLSFDIKVDPASFVTTGGANYGNLQVGLTTRTSWDNRINPPSRTIPLSATNWTHFDIPVDPAWNYLHEVVGFYIYQWSGEAHTNNLIFNIDNIMLTKPTAPVVIPPPTVSLAKPVPGLAFVAASGGQWDRQNITTVGDNYSWIGASGPVSYSVTVAAHAAINHANCQLHMYFVPGAPTGNGPDWDNPDVFMWRMNNQADGTAWSDIRYKTNAPGANGPAGMPNFLWEQGSLGGVGNDTPVGKWTVTFEQNTNVTVTAPNGGTHTTNFPPHLVSTFSNPMYIYVGFVPGSLDRLGASAVISNVKFAGMPGAASVDSSFPVESLDTNIWQIRASSPTWGVQMIPADAAYWVKWTLPALGFSLQKSAILDGPWVGSTSTGYSAGGMYNVLLRQGDLPGTDSGYFRLTKRTFSKLQILLPGETAAPGTPTGKTGTPDPIVQYSTFDVRVNAVDNEWYPISGVSITDTVRLTLDEPTPIQPFWEAAMANGTVTFVGLDLSLLFQTAGNWSITASDVTDPTKGTNSVPVTVAPWTP